MVEISIPTLEDVASAAGVSTATVSRALNTPDRVAVATRARIESAVERLGYSPNFGARALASNRTHLVGAVVPTLDNAIFARGLQALESALGEGGTTLLVASSGYDAVAEERQIRALVARGADGLLLVGHHRDAAVRRFLARRDVRTVIAWSYRASASVDCVGFDNAAAMSDLADRALALGHRDFGLIAAPTRDNDRARDRVRGARVAIEAAGCVAPPLLEAPYEIEAAGNALERLVERRPRPTVVLCGNDVQAVGAIKRARALGLRVPEALSVTGFDDLEIATVVEPALTTVRVPHETMGRRAAELLLAPTASASDAPRMLTRVALPVEIVMRDSLARAPDTRT